MPLRYKLERSLRETLFGEVFLGRDTKTNMRVVIKKCALQNVENSISIRGQHVRENVREEIRIHNELCNQETISPYIIRQLDIVYETDSIQIVLEFAGGGELLNHIFARTRKAETQKPQKNESKREDNELSNNSLLNNNVQSCSSNSQKLRNFCTCSDDDANTQKLLNNFNKLYTNEIEARKFMRQLVEGVSYLHSHSIAHRDLSLENLLLDENGNLKIIDFGVAIGGQSSKMSDGNQFCVGQVGKTGYMAPEVQSGSQYDARAADIQSMGVICFILLTGCPPYQLPQGFDGRRGGDRRFMLIIRGRIRDLLRHQKFLDLFSEQAIDLLQRMLSPENIRIRMNELLIHPFIIDCNICGLEKISDDVNVNLEHNKDCIDNNDPLNDLSKIENSGLTFRNFDEKFKSNTDTLRENFKHKD